MGLKKWSKNSSLYKLLDKEGFYIILFLCICIVATTAVWVTKKNIEEFTAEDIKNPSLEENESLDSMDMGLNAHESTIIVEEIEEDEKLEATSSNVVESKPKEVKEEVKKEVVKNKKIEMIKPVTGEKGMDYAANRLIYSKTLDQYTTHNGIDIMASENTPVVAALEGKVVEVVTDSQLGITIALSHGDQMITKYANLNTGDLVKVGDWVEKGQRISGVGKTALFETLEEPHLHFEVLIDGKNVNPNGFLSNKN
ncbi:M23 family metallopeptidase [Crassaminicella profunda]|uniref:M23 family metallopeptidase n=1 Tax=Crassaminicella profunda TaxID=1286698 RepID=UPI001CA628F5|nr:M23 family metallopeptidase [Crassaminicella profunda]QZY55533.1 M23 family metallopeptidase [Crassaminicella profunda]